MVAILGIPGDQLAKKNMITYEGGPPEGFAGRVAAPELSLQSRLAEVPALDQSAFRDS